MGSASTVRLCFGVLAAACLLSGCTEDDSVTHPTKPNIVVVITDDQTFEQLSARSMPYTHRALEEGGTSFTDAIVTTPFCCPARASFLTGEYVHNNGAFTSYKDFDRRKDNLATWLDFAGYRTALIGKYLNQYEKFAPTETTAAPGWDQWRMLIEPLTYYDYDVAVNGEKVHKGSRPRDYSTTYLNREAVKLVEKWAPEEPPFFIWLAPHAPHDEQGKSGGPCEGKAVPAPGDLAKFRSAEQPMPPSFNERNVSDKPAYIQALPRLDAKETDQIRHHYQCRLASLREVDRGVADIAHELRDQDELDDTILVLSSDNGLYHGQHRLDDGKRLPYVEALDVPFLWRVPASVADGEVVERVAQPVANIDLAPTLLELANVPPCRAPDACTVMDGRSLVPLLRGESDEWPKDRARGIEMRKCDWTGVIADDQVVVHYTTVPLSGSKRGCEPADVYERYLLDEDPYQLRNLATSEADIPKPLLRRLGRLENCVGISGRDPAPPEGASYCE